MLRASATAGGERLQLADERKLDRTNKAMRTGIFKADVESAADQTIWIAGPTAAATRTAAAMTAPTNETAIWGRLDWFIVRSFRLEPRDHRAAMPSLCSICANLADH